MVVMMAGDNRVGGGSPDPPGERLDKAVSFTPRTACTRRRRCNAMSNIPPQSLSLARGPPGDRFSRSDAPRLSGGGERRERETGGCDRWREGQRPGRLGFDNGRRGNSGVTGRAARNVWGSRWEGLTESTCIQRVGCPGVTFQKFLERLSIQRCRENLPISS